MWTDGLLLTSLEILARAPLVGQVKTRLIPALGPRGAAQAHEQLLSHVLTIALSWQGVKVDRGLHLWCTPDSNHPYFDTLLPLSHRRCQPSGDLGQRMATIVDESLKRSRQVILLGGDAASISTRLLDQVEAALQEVPVVMAPAEDGGYILLGLTRSAPTLFSSMPWGTEHVAEQTRSRLRDLGWPWREFPGQWDVDRGEDWDRFRRQFL
ncbi:MAG: TIGR04282 family arsenosugar biosynthesis glycosyltransferase [Magnetococcales bacterium]|nr:TIGR04282 family arsenosugar biosynthesis glycosyltransferase [Magnetococcales bacterium]